MRPYGSYREYVRDVLIAIALFMIAAEAAAWIAPIFEHILGSVTGYAIAFSLGMVPFLLFARRAGALELDLVDFFALPLMGVLLANCWIMLRQVGAMGVPDTLISSGAFLVFCSAYNAIRKWLMPRQTKDATTD